MKPGYFILIFVLVFVSCTVPGSLHPLTKNAAELFYNPALVGQWESSDSPNEIYLITEGDDPAEKYYHCTIYSKDDPNEDSLHFFARLIKLNGLNYLDCWYNLKKSGRENKDLVYYNVPRHFFYKVKIINNNSVELHSPDMDEIMKLVKDGKIALKVANLQSLDINDDYLVISETPELQKAFIEFEKFASMVYKDTSTFTRIH